MVEVMAGECGTPHRSDSGGASFLEELWGAVQACATCGWDVGSIPCLLLQSSTAPPPPGDAAANAGTQAAAAAALVGRLAAATTHDLPPVAVPPFPPAPPALCGASADDGVAADGKAQSIRSRMQGMDPKEQALRAIYVRQVRVLLGLGAIRGA
jgi:hypothetical protein